MKNIVLYVLLVFFIIVNGFFLFNYLGKPGKERPKSPSDFLAKELNFDEKQMVQYELLVGNHHKRLHVLKEESKRLKRELFLKVTNKGVDEMVIDSLTTLIGQTKKKDEQITFNHLKKIEALCNDKQKQKMRLIINKALRIGANKDGPPPPHPRHPPRPNN